MPFQTIGLLPLRTERVHDSPMSPLDDGEPRERLPEEVERRKRAEARVRHLNRVLRSINNVNQLIVRENDPERLITRACELLRDVRGYHNAWIVLVDPAGRPTFRCGAGLDSTFDRAEELSLDRMPQCVARVLQEGEAFISDDPQESCAGCPLAEDYAGRGAAAVRMEHGSRVYGVLVVSVPKEFIRDEEELALLREVADDLAFALDRIGLERERDAAFEALLESEARYRVLFECAQDAIFLIEDGRFIACNDATLAMFGCGSRGDILGSRPRDLSPEVQPDGVGSEEKAELLLSATMSGNPVSFEWRHARLDGSEFDAEVSLSSLPLEERECAMAVVRDISGRKRAKEELRASEEKYRSLFENMLNGFALHEVVLDGEGNPSDYVFLEMNGAFEELTGIAAESAVGRRVTEVIPGIAEDPADWIGLYGEVALTGRPIRFRQYSEALDRWFSISAFSPEEGRFATIFEDISKRMRAERGLKESEERYRSLVEGSIQGLVIAQADPVRLSFASRPMEEITGYSPEELTSMGPAELAGLIHPEEREEFFARFRRRLAGEPVPQRNEYRIVARDGSVRWVDMYSTLIEFGNAPATQTIFLDITERKRAEEQSRRLELQMHRARRLESIGRLAGGVAHDLNNMLSPILGYGEMLLDETTARDHRREPLQEIVRAAVRARNLVRQLLTFGRRQALELRRVDIGQLVSNLIELMRRTIPESIGIELVPPGELPPVTGDIGQLEQVLMNLVVNARDALPEGGRITIETALVELDREYSETHEGVLPGEYVMLCVSDDGCGMDPDILEHAFEPFYTTKEDEQGTGLGLATVYGIVKRHGGNIWVYSEPGEGTSFKVYLPVPGEPAAGAPHPAPELPDGGGSETILLVEDEEQVRKLTRSLLEKRGYTLLSASDGAEAIELARSHGERLDLLLTDVVMPGMNGRELYEELLRDHSEMKVLYMSGYTDNVIAHHGIIEEGVEFLQKPFSARMLAGRVREVLDT